MPRSTVSDNFKRESFARESGDVHIVLVTIDHDDLSDPINVTQDPMQVLSTGVRGVVSNAVEYSAVPLEITLPVEDEDRMPMAQLKVDNIDRDILMAVRAIGSPPDVTIKIVLASDPDVEEIVIDGFQIGKVTADAFTISGDLTTERLDLAPWPPGKFTPDKFPGLF
jgi:hypothetical protein